MTGSTEPERELRRQASHKASQARPVTGSTEPERELRRVAPILILLSVQEVTGSTEPERELRLESGDGELF